MKKILLFFGLITALISEAQFPATITSGNSSTLQKAVGAYGAAIGYVFAGTYGDTTAANVSFIKNVPGIVIRIGDDLWIRNNAATTWIKIGAGAGTASLTQYRLAIGDASNLLSTAAAITGSRALVSDANGVPTHSATTATQIGYLSGVTSDVQTQIDSKRATFTNGIYLSQTNGALYSTSPKVSISSDTLFSFGDSFTAGYGVGAGEGYIPIFANRYGLILNNQALSASGVWQAAKNANAVIVPGSNNDVVSVMAGFNDLRRNGSATATLKKIVTCLSSIIANNLIDTFFAANNARVTASGTWTSNPLENFGGKTGSTIGGQGKYNNVSGSYLEWTATGQNFIVGYLNNVTSGSNGGEFDVYVDGTLYAHVIADQADGVSDGVNSNLLAPGVVFVKGLTSASHTIRITNTTNNYDYIDYFATVKLPKNTAPVLISLIPKMDATGYATTPNLGSNTVFEKGDSAIISTVNQFYGWPVSFVPVNDYYNLSIGLSSSDHIHPNKIGYRQIADAFSNHVFTSGSVAVVTPDTLQGLQSVTDVGATTTNNIQVAKLGVGRSPTTEIDIYKTHPSFLVQDNTAGSNGTGGFFGHYYDGSSLDAVLFASNRNPTTGTIINGGRTTGQMGILSTANGTSSNFIFYTTAIAGAPPLPYVGIHKSLSVGSSYYATDAGDGTGIFESTVGIGVSSPTARLHLHAGAAGANSAPLKINAGTVLSTTEAGAIENDGAHLYYTATNGGTRYQLDQQSSSGITSLGVSGSGQTGATQTLATGTSGTDFNIGSSSNTHTFNIPTFSSTARGLVTNSGTSNTTDFLRRDGSWAVPTATTPTLQQVLTAGSTLTTNNTVATGANTLTISTSTAGVNPLYVSSNSDYAIRGVSTSAVAISGQSTSDVALSGYSGAVEAIVGTTQPTTTSTVAPVMRLSRASTGTAANGMGASLDFNVTTNGGGDYTNKIESFWSDATHATRKAQMNIKGTYNGTEETFMNIQHNLVRINNNADTLATQAYARSVAGGGGIIAPHGVTVLKNYVTQTTSTGSGTTDNVTVVSVPANALSANGDAIVIEFGYTTTGVDTKSTNVVIGSSSSLVASGGSTTAGYYTQKVKIFRTSSTAGFLRSETWRDFSMQAIANTSVSSFDWTTSQNIVASITSTTAASITINYITVRIEKE